MPKTKIIATLGPSSSKETVLRKMMISGLDVARLNFSHGKRAEHIEKINLIRKLNAKYKRRVRILGDLKGNRIRIGKLKKPLEIKKNKIFSLVRGKKYSAAEIPFDYQGDMNVIKKGSLIFIDDGNIRLKTLKTEKNRLKTKALTGGILKSNKGVNIPEAKLDFPLLSAEDISDLNFAIEHKLDYIAHSFVRSKKELLAVKKILKPALPKAKLIAKIEAREAVKNFDEIVSEADMVMIARGDMGISFPIWEVPFLQKSIIKKCAKRKKPVITATQMLESMTENFLPTRAEVSDIANAILDGTDFVMLSGETAAGKYPVESVNMMNEIIKYAEQASSKTK